MANYADLIQRLRKDEGSALYETANEAADIINELLADARRYRSIRAKTVRQARYYGLDWYDPKIYDASIDAEMQEGSDD